MLPFKHVGIVAACRAKIRGYRRVWNHQSQHGIGALNLQPEPDNEIYGVALLLTDSGLAALDTKEGFKPDDHPGSSYIRQATRIELDIIPPLSVDGFLYLSNRPQKDPIPTSYIYQGFVVKGAIFFNLPEQDIEAFKNANAIGVIGWVFPAEEPVTGHPDDPYPDDIDKAPDPDSEFAVLKDTVDKLTVPQYKQLGGTYLANLEKSYNLILLPYNFITKTKVAEVTASIISKEWEAAYNHLIMSGEFVDQEIKEKQMKERIQAQFQNKTTMELIVKSTHEQVIQEVKNDPEIAEYVHALLSASISFTWTSFESFSRDLWIEAVNKYPLEFAQKCTGDKSINISRLAELKFEVTDHMGLLLADKCDFSNLKNIISSFDSILENRFRGIKDEYEAGKYMDLFTTEKLRHLVQHKAGIVDKKFIKEIGTRWTGPAVKENERVKLNYATALSGIQSAASLGSRMLTLLDRLAKDS